MKQEFIDLGLPSGTLWAKHNVQIGSKKHFTHDEAIKIAKDIHLSLPTDDDFRELMYECKWKWTTLFGKVTGYKITGPNGKSIFLSITGCFDGSILKGSGAYGYYWSTTYCSSFYAYLLNFSSNIKFIDYGNKSYGFSIRLIKHKRI